MAYQTYDIFEAMQSDVRAADPQARFGPLRVDGGASRNDLLMQFQADLLGVEVDRPTQIETTAQGAAFLAGLGAGFWTDATALAAARQSDRRFVPQADPSRRDALLAGWRRAVQRVLDA
jgi:glycerol kinase